MVKDKFKSSPLAVGFAADTLTPIADKVTRGVSGFGVATAFLELSPVAVSASKDQKQKRPELLSEQSYYV